MAFTCIKCASQEDQWLFDFGISWGRCEICRKMAECKDIK